MMKQILTFKTLILLVVLAFAVKANQSAFAQSAPCSYEPCPYTGNQRFKVGDVVEATYLGEWKKAVILGGYEENENGATYEIKFEGANYSFGRISAKWVRPLKQSNSAVQTNTSNNQINSNGDFGNSTNTSSGGQFKTGDGVLYKNSAIWSSGAKIVSYDAEKRQYRLRFESGSGDIVPCHSVFKPGEKAGSEFFVGKWDVRIIGATSTFTRDGDLYRRYSSGMKLPPLEIKANGTFVWVTDKGTINGSWKPRGEGVPGIVLLKGEGGLDYTLYEKTEGYAPTKETRDEIGLHHIPSSTGHYTAYRIGENKSCVLTERAFK